jgi:hypothetical protein
LWNGACGAGSGDARADSSRTRDCLFASPADVQVGSRNLGKDLGNLLDNAFAREQLLGQEDGGADHGDSPHHQFDAVQLPRPLHEFVPSQRKRRPVLRREGPSFRGTGTSFGGRPRWLLVRQRRGRKTRGCSEPALRAVRISSCVTQARLDLKGRGSLACQHYREQHPKTMARASNGSRRCACHGDCGRCK